MEKHEIFTLKNKNGLVAKFSNYGARWISMETPDRNGCFQDVVLGFDSLNGYINANEKYHGAIVGRVCGRINNAKFQLNGHEYRLEDNDVYGTPVHNHLHGGSIAFHNQFWDGVYTSADGEESVTFCLLSKDGDCGYPGNLIVGVTYILRNDNRLSMICEAMSDKATPVNLTNHAFFNLGGVDKQESMLCHRLRIASSNIIDCDEELIPTGRLMPVENTGLDFRGTITIGDSLNSGLFNIKENKGFSIAFSLDSNDEKMKTAAVLSDDKTGRRMSVITDQESLQVYTGYFMDGSDVGKFDVPYYSTSGIALETQGFPDAVNNPGFPSIIVEPGVMYRNLTDYLFEIF